MVDVNIELPKDPVVTKAEVVMALEAPEPFALDDTDKAEPVPVDVAVETDARAP